MEEDVVRDLAAILRVFHVTEMWWIRRCIVMDRVGNTLRPSPVRCQSRGFVRLLILWLRVSRPASLGQFTTRSNG